MSEISNYYIQDQIQYQSSPKTRPGWIRRYNFALQHVRSNDLVVDCGCGIGEGTALLAQKCQKAYGIDIDTYIIDYCRTNHSEAEFICHDVSRNCPFGADSIDVVVAIDLLEYMPTAHALHRALANMNQIMKPGAFIVTGGPNWHGQDHRTLIRLLKMQVLKFLGSYIKRQAHWHERYRLWTPETLRAILENHFETVSVYGERAEGITQDLRKAPHLIARARKAM